MKQKMSDIAFLKSMLDAIDAINAHKQSQPAGDTLNEAVTFRLITVGEAAARITKELREKYPDVEWAVIAATRNRIVHGYWDIDFQRVWNIIDNYLPQLRTQIETIIRKEEGN